MAYACNAKSCSMPRGSLKKGRKSMYFAFLCKII